LKGEIDMQVLLWIVSRLKEPSTWAGFAGIFSALGLSEQMSTAIVGAGAGVAALIAVVLAEKAKAAAKPPTP
jgi:hypothetical protein